MDTEIYMSAVSHIEKFSLNFHFMVNIYLFGIFLSLKVILNMSRLIQNAVTDCRDSLSCKMGGNVIVTVWIPNLATRVYIIYLWEIYFTIIALTIKASTHPTQR